MLIERAYSAKWTLPHGDDYSFSHTYGRHINEYNIKPEALTPG